MKTKLSSLAVGDLEQSRVALAGAGEGAALVALLVIRALDRWSSERRTR